jgi:hypothetical protein
MVELVVNAVTENNGLKQYLVLDELTVIQNYKTVFGEQGMVGLANAFKIYENSRFYEIKRYYQFIGLIKFISRPKSLTMSLFEIENMDNYLDAFKQLTTEKWKQVDIQKIGNITQEILNDNNKELASIQIKKLF